jgi:transcriptional regulator with XRE-family HTH domain
MFAHMVSDWKKHLRDAIAESGMTQHALSKSIGRNDHYVSQLLTRSYTPSVRTLEPIANQLGITVTDLLEGPSAELDARRIAADIERLPLKRREIVINLIRDLQEDSDDSVNGNSIHDT